MSKIDIFKEAKEKVIPTWAKFENDGDTVQGTYVGKIVGQIDNYGHEQIIYQLLQDDGSILNVGFGLNKKFLIQEMEGVNWGQIVGFIFKGTISVKDKRRPGNMVDVKDYRVHQDSKIVDQKWLDENKDNMPDVVYVSETPNQVEIRKSKIEADKEFEAVGTVQDQEEPPFLSVKEKLSVIEKLAKDKLGSVDAETTKVAVMEKLGIAFIPVQYDSIIEKLTEL